MVSAARGDLKWAVHEAGRVGFEWSAGVSWELYEPAYGLLSSSSQSDIADFATVVQGLRYAMNRSREGQDVLLGIAGVRVVGNSVVGGRKVDCAYHLRLTR